MNLRQRLLALRPAIAQTAQKIVDEWQVDEEGFDPELGAGGICDRVADAIIETIYRQLDGVDAAPGAPEGEEHQWVVASDGETAAIIDIPPGVYETGGGYNWKKIEGARIEPGDVFVGSLGLELAQDLLKEGGRMRRLVVLAEALKALGEKNSAMLVCALARFAQEWADRFFKANPELLERAERFAEAEGIELGQYLNSLSQLSEWAGRQRISRDLGYVGMPWSPRQKPAAGPKAKPEPKLQPETELRWPFPPPNVLQDERAFLAASVAWALGEGREMYEQMHGSSKGLRNAGRRGEVQAARAYLRHLMKDVAPQLAATLQVKWRDASAGRDAEAQQTLRHWWESLSDVWELLQRMISTVNAYEQEG
jgi:hypothetical protein